MHTLQRNLSDNVEGHTYYESMFVWNEYLTRRIRNNVKDCMWTVALVYGFFKQVLLVLISPKVSINIFKHSKICILQAGVVVF